MFWLELLYQNKDFDEYMEHKGRATGTEFWRKLSSILEGCVFMFRVSQKEVHWEQEIFRSPSPLNRDRQIVMGQVRVSSRAGLPGGGGAKAIRVCSMMGGLPSTLNSSYPLWQDCEASWLTVLEIGTVFRIVGSFPWGIISPPNESHTTVLLQILRSYTRGFQAINHQLQQPTEVKLRSGVGRNSVIKEISSAQRRCGPDKPELSVLFDWA